MKIVIVGTDRIFEVRVIDDQVGSRLTRLVLPTRAAGGKRRGFRRARAPAAAIEAYDQVLRGADALDARPGLREAIGQA